MKIKNITDIFFDLDHTLWDFDKNSKLTFDKIFRMHDVQINLDEFIEHYEPINLQYWKLYRDEKIDKAYLRFNRLNDTFKRLGFKADSTLTHKLSQDYISHLTTFNHLFKDVFYILEYLQENYRLHVITNGFNEVQKRKLKNAKIDHFFHTVTDSESVGVKKPNAKIFNYALQQAQAKPSTSIMIGDNLEADIEGALNAGIDAICFNVHSAKIDGSIKQITQLHELQHYL
ncbi:MAG: noncanonical pyrimidine nucleotidase, YjjG family [Algicola sp.]|nr:noncanonical pyrimidine nucleotidase, YjjG family [Algicola sp.]